MWPNTNDLQKRNLFPANNMSYHSGMQTPSLSITSHKTNRD